VLSSLCGLESTFAQAVNDTLPTQIGRRDTVVIIQRDTVVVIQKETVRIIHENSEEGDKRELSRGRGGTGRGRGSSNQEAIEARRKMREERIREYEEWYAAQPIVRSGNAWGYKFYPTALGQVDFPSIKFGVERTFNGRLGLQGNLGFLITPSELWTFGWERNIGTPRFGIRGLDLGFNSRYYISDTKKAFPFYMEFEASFSIAPLEMGIWTTSSDGTFQEFVQAPVNGQQFYLGFIAGWELRTKEKILLDLATGFRIGTKGIKSSNPIVQAEISQDHWNINDNGVAPLFSIVTRVGIGYGRWSPSEETSNSRNKKTYSKSKRKRKKKRR